MVGCIVPPLTGHSYTANVTSYQSILSCSERFNWLIRNELTFPDLELSCFIKLQAQLVRCFFGEFKLSLQSPETHGASPAIAGEAL